MAHFRPNSGRPPADLRQTSGLNSLLFRLRVGDPWSLSEIFDDDLCDDDLLNDLCAYTP